jgi:hypothetical protein
VDAAALSTTFEPGLLKRVKNFVLRLHPQARGRSSWADGTALRDALPEEVARPQRTITGKEYLLPSIFNL